MQAAAAVAEVETAEPLDAVLVAGRDPVEVVLHRGREVVVHQPAEVLLQQADDREGEEGRHESAAALEDVAAVEDRAEDRRVRRRPADAELLERPHQRRLGVARGRVRLVALRLERAQLDRVSLGEVRQAPLLVVLLCRAVVVAAFLVSGEEATERDHRARGSELDLLVRARLSGDPQRDGLALRVLHLRRDRPHPDQLVERMLVRRELRAHLLRRAEAVARRPDRLVGLLRVLDLPLVAARLGRDVVGAEQGRRLLARGGQRRLGQRRRVGAHVRDVAVLVEALGDPHRRLRRVAELAARLLLEGRRHERRARATAVRLPLDPGDVEGGAVQPRGQAACAVLVEPAGLAAQLPVHAEVAARCDALPVERDEPRLEGLRIEGREQVPPLGRAERHSLALPLDDEACRHRLDAAGREPGHDLLPEHRRDLVAVEAVEDAARLLRVDEPLVDLARVVQCGLDRRAGDLVEDHSPDGNLRLQHLEQVPRDRLSFAVLVRREQELVGVGELLAQLRDGPLLVGVDDVQRLEAVLDVDAEARPRLAFVLLRDLGGAVREVANVADRGLDDELGPEVAGDRARLCRRLDDDETLRHGRSR